MHVTPPARQVSVVPAAVRSAAPPSRLRVALLLARPLSRAIDWAPLVVVAVFVTGVVSLVRYGEELSGSNALVLMRICGTLLGAAAAFGLVDAMAADLGAAAVPRWVRQALRCLLPGGAAIAIWLAAFSYILTRLPEGSLFPVGDLLIEVGVCLGIALAAAATAVRFTPGRQAAMAAVVVQLAMVLGTILLPQQLRLWPPTCGFGYWDQAHLFWLAMLPLPYLWLILAGLDLRRSRWRRATRTR
ncbi:hypothetical protein [Nonomuraea jiangxiensis]|uniref:ABC-2 type transport system permease protein n=1 Tax=Nonomuraea jiangxiensis TaxID=633440 RepID=A0A1G8FNI2_9ACTN|nr:hypothetical protein [Nonomuraea jiangxiensis]SDH83566.1 hypothetical protein SAMN05421869_103371 [Nonomuraea jiangxiensis]